MLLLDSEVRVSYLSQESNQTPPLPHPPLIAGQLMFLYPYTVTDVVR